MPYFFEQFSARTARKTLAFLGEGTIPRSSSSGASQRIDYLLGSHATLFRTIFRKNLPDKSLGRFSEHAKDKGGIERIRENLRHYFDREFERMRSFNEQFYEKIGSPNARQQDSKNFSKNGEARVRTFAKNFCKLQKLLQRQRSKRFSDRRAGESSSTLTKKRTENRETTITNGRGYPTSGSGSFHVNS